MKRSLIVIILLLNMFWGYKSYAQSQFSPIMTKMENSLFGIDYNNQADEQRLKRLEERVYGTTSSKTISQRVDKLSKDLSADLIGQEIKPKEDTFANEDDAIKEAIPKADSNVNYPIVNQLENQVFKKENKKQDINQRLSNLEQKVFSQVYNDDLNSRVERLKNAISPQNQVAKNEEDDFIPEYNDLLSQNSTSKDEYFSTPNFNKNNSVLDEYDDTSDVTIPLSALEKSVFKKAFADDSVSNRLSRLEAQIFRSNFSQDDPQTRLDRLTSAQRAQKSASKYDNNKFTQHMSTAMQIGAMLLMVLACVI